MCDGGRIEHIEVWRQAAAGQAGKPPGPLGGRSAAGERHVVADLAPEADREGDELTALLAFRRPARWVQSGMPASGLAVLNYDDDLVRKMATRTRADAAERVQELRERFPLAHGKYSASQELGLGWFRFHFNNGARPFSEMREFLASRGIAVTGLDELEPNLEDLYLDLTGKGLQADASPS